MALNFVAVVTGAGGNSISFQITNPGGVINQPLSITVVGNAITVNPATGGAGFISSIESAVVTALQAVPAVNALVTVSSDFPAGLVAPAGIQFLSGGSGSASGGYAGLDPGTFKIRLQDTNQVDVSNVPLLWSNLIHVPRVAPTLVSQAPANAIPENFWPTPPMLYRVNAFIQFFIYVTSSTPLGGASTWDFLFSGVRRYPCK